MSDEYVAVNGQRLTEEMIERWCEAYEQGEFPQGEHTVGQVVYGIPSSSNEETIMTIRIPANMKQAVEKAAERSGVSTNAYIRSALADRLLTA